MRKLTDTAYKDHWLNVLRAHFGLLILEKTALVLSASSSFGKKKHCYRKSATVRNSRACWK